MPQDDTEFEQIQTQIGSPLTRRGLLRGAGLAAAGLSALGGEGILAGLAGATTRATPSLAQTAHDAVIFGVPVVLQSRYLLLSERAGVKRNRFSVNLDLSTPTTKAAGPNDDTLYGLTWLDLTSEPQVIAVPATRGRYYSIQLIDMWSNSFAYIGLRATGDQAGAFAITPPDWTGTLPTGVRHIKSPTKRLLALVRTFVKDPSDLKAARRIHTSYTTGQLSRYPHGRVRPHVEPNAAALNVFAPIDLSNSGISLYREINSLISEYPPLPGDATYAKALRPVGVDVARYRTPGASLASALTQAIKPAISTILTETRSDLSAVNDWSVNFHVANITHNPLRRAALTIEGPGTHVAKEALYFAIAELAGVPLTGANSYTLTFPRGQQPPVGAFWSLILYDATTFLLVPNPINRYELASHTDHLTYASDGSLKIGIQNTQPPAAGLNWLPSPAGSFRLILRTYLPKPAIFNGGWTPPALQQVA